MAEKNKDEIKQLKEAIETSVGRPIRTPRDFDFLRKCIFARTHEMISVSTLKRIWEYMPQGNIRETTLSLLSQFVGYKCWDAFLKGERTEGSSDFVLNRHLWSEDIDVGTTIELIWHPGRRCLVKHIGDSKFEVVESENTKLQTGMTFRCSMFIEGEPLFIDQLTIGNGNTVSYVCGKISGIQFNIL